MNEVFRAKLNEEGRLVIPAACRKKAGIRTGQEVFLQVHEQGVLVYTQDIALKRVQNWVASKLAPGASLAAELIAERHAETAKHASE